MFAHTTSLSSRHSVMSLDEFYQDSNSSNATASAMTMQSLVFLTCSPVSPGRPCQPPKVGATLIRVLTSARFSGDLTAYNPANTTTDADAESIDTNQGEEDDEDMPSTISLVPGPGEASDVLFEVARYLGWHQMRLISPRCKTSLELSQYLFPMAEQHQACGKWGAAASLGFY